jgi:hypothetical protein
MNISLGVAALIFDHRSVSLPAVLPVYAEKQPGGERIIPPGYDAMHRGFPYRLSTNGEVAALTADGERRFKDWDEFAAGHVK